MSYLSKIVLKEIHSLQGSPSALDRGVGERENCVARLEALEGPEGLLHIVGGVVGTDTRIVLQCLLGAGHLREGKKSIEKTARRG